VEANSTGGQGSRRAVAPYDNNDSSSEDDERERWKCSRTDASDEHKIN
jgi:hypothetical protein